MSDQAYERHEVVDGVRLMHYSAFTKLVLDHGEGGDWASYGEIETFANAGNSITLIVEDAPEVIDGAYDFGHAAVSQPTCFGRCQAAKLTSEADTAEVNAQQRAVAS